VEGWGEEHREERVVKNEVAYRAYNDRRAEMERRGSVAEDEPVPFVCECGQSDCTDPIEISVEAWERIHAEPNRFVIRNGHQYPEYERVVDEFRRYLIVEKFAPVD